MNKLGDSDDPDPMLEYGDSIRFINPETSMASSTEEQFAHIETIGLIGAFLLLIAFLYIFLV